MLKLKNIKKTYEIGGNMKVEALKGIDVNFRKSEFVSILGPSGCGKTTLLNIIGGLDHPTDGDLIINGVSTKKYGARDWDTYRNHSIGFVFQSYNLIPHMSVLANVELAPVIAGVSKSERRKKAVEALEKVGLGDQLSKKPNQLSGGQMQRVAIARALVNDPEILLADEPTGALDTQTSIQIMEILKSISKDRLIIMVTHNPELAENYSSRIVSLKDGLVVGDTNPYEGDAEGSGQTNKKSKKDKKASMSFLTALSLSTRNLMTKKGRTFLTSFAGSIGIIGIALILSMSNGISSFIDTVQEDALSTFPMTVNKYSSDTAAIFDAMTKAKDDRESKVYEEDRIYPNDAMGSVLDAMMNYKENDIRSFKNYFEENFDEIRDDITAYKYVYDLSISIYNPETNFKKNDVTQINPTTIFNYMGDEINTMMSSLTAMSSGSTLSFFGEMLEGIPDEDGNRDLINPVVKSQYNLVGKESRWPENADEIVIMVDEHNCISNMALYALGFKDPTEIKDMMSSLFDPSKEYENGIEEGFSYSISDFVGHSFYYVNNTDFYEKTSETYTVSGVTFPVWQDIRKQPGFDEEEFINKHGKELKIVGIIKENPDSTSTSISTVANYTAALSRDIIAYNNSSEIAAQQLRTPGYDVLTGMPFDSTSYTTENVEEFLALLSPQKKAELVGIANNITQSSLKISGLPKLISLMSDEEFNRIVSSFTPDQSYRKDDAQSFLEAIGEEGQNALLETFKAEMTITEDNLVEKLKQSDQKSYAQIVAVFMPDNMQNNYDARLTELGYEDDSRITTIQLFAKSFESKNVITDFIDSYNAQAGEDHQVEVTDLVGALLSGITTIINAISYVLIAFVAISLVVSSIMIAIITYISVLERTKEIGILRSLGASKRNIRNVFNAETLIEGFSSGLLGVIVTLILCLIVNPILHAVTGIGTINAALPANAAVILIAISMLLTFIAGLIPANMASKKDPVIALRTE